MSQSSPVIQPFVDTMFGENAYVVSADGDGGSRIGWVIDPGLGDQSERMREYLAAKAIQLETILLTHGHADHIAGVDALREAYPSAQVLIGEPDRAMLHDPQMNMSAPFGFPMTIQTEADGDLEPDSKLLLGDTAWRILDTSGHSPGGRSFYNEQAGVVFTGDALFCRSIGRTDLPTADTNRLISNIREHLLTLPDETKVYSGHGPMTTIGNERKSNPFLTDAY